MRFWAMTIAFGITALGAIEAHAQPSGQDVATAQALFDEGKRLMALHSYAEACPKLVESQRIDPGGGTLFAIALCHEGEGKTATAWAEFSTALTEARKDRRTDRETAAADHVRALEAKLTRVRVAPVAKADGLEIKRDGARLGDPQWGLALPVDPGEHTFEATAPGKRPWRQVVDVRGEGSTVDVAVPALEDAPKVEAPTAAVPTPPPAARAAPPPAEPSSQKSWAIVAGTLGLVAAGVGVGFGLSASSKWSEAESACPNRACRTVADKELGHRAGTAADVSTVLVTVGAAGAAAGIVLWLTAPSDDKSQRALSLTPTASMASVGLTLGGSL